MPHKLRANALKTTVRVCSMIYQSIYRFTPLHFLRLSVSFWNAGACEISLKHKLNSSIPYVDAWRSANWNWLCIYSNEMLKFSLIESGSCELIPPYFHYRLVEIDWYIEFMVDQNKKTHTPTEAIDLFSFEWPICWQQTSANND